MKKLLILLLVVCFVIIQTPLVSAYTYVQGYWKGSTYVSPHIRTNPNALRYDNYSYTGGNLYNKSYYYSNKSYSSNWYKPAWETDSSYFQGKSSYDLNRINKLNNKSYNYSYTLPSYTY